MIAVLTYLNYGLVLLFGSLLSVGFAGGCSTKKEKKSLVAVILIILCIQMICAFLFDIKFVRQIYPLISHLPLIILLRVRFKKNIGISVVSVLTAYSCCQIPRWIGTIALYLFHTPIAFFLTSSISIIPLLLLLRKYSTGPVYQVITYSRPTLLLFGGLPLFYYLFDYATMVYTDVLYRDIQMVTELLPTVMVLFYIVFVVVYHNEVKKRNKIELDNKILVMQFEQAANQIEDIKNAQEQAMIYRHDMRHHFSLIGEFLSNGDIASAMDYIGKVQSDIKKATPIKYCLNNTINLILLSFSSKASSLGIKMRITSNLPEILPLPETEVCSILSNGLENAIKATASVLSAEKLITVHCRIHKGHFLIYIENPYEGEIVMKNGVPHTSIEGHGFGVRSIEMLAKKYNGYCSFEPKNNYFLMKVVLLLEENVL